ncbi:hypothetical protein NDU88_003294 [Pleurodeles waltl]|uniref:Uncharacterized protein n=1 Tax=Pleurodeles waltl TaxID=8319 RepID=A0AAV7SFV3_PLEWA|nr:hypothetical protein NDU88_003294 [Pleurodeles waltl]
MVARAAPREQEELLKDALSRTVKTPRVRRETVERLALRGCDPEGSQGLDGLVSVSWSPEESLLGKLGDRGLEETKGNEGSEGENREFLTLSKRSMSIHNLRGRLAGGASVKASLEAGGAEGITGEAENFAHSHAIC